MARHEKKLEHRVDENGCWICTSHAANGKGYPYLKRNGKRIAAHRYSYIKHKGEIPDGLLIRHTCDVRNCINPDHLITGTEKDNAMDMVERGRACCGERHPQRKLSESQVEYIRTHPHLSAQALADTLGVHNATIYRARKGMSWKHIETTH